MKHLTSLGLSLLAAACMTSCDTPSRGLADHGHISTFNVPYRNSDGGPYSRPRTIGHHHPALIPVGESGGAYYHNGRYHSGGSYETGHFHDRGRYYTTRYYHDGRYYYGGTYRQADRTSNVWGVNYHPDR